MVSGEEVTASGRYSFRPSWPEHTRTTLGHWCLCFRFWCANSGRKRSEAGLEDKIRARFYFRKAHMESMTTRRIVPASCSSPSSPLLVPFLLPSPPSPPSHPPTSLPLTCCTHIFLHSLSAPIRTPSCVSHTHGSGVRKKVFAVCMSLISISPSPFSCLTYLLLSLYEDSLSRLYRPHVLAVLTCLRSAGACASPHEQREV